MYPQLEGEAVRFSTFPIIQRAVARELLLTFAFSSAIILGLITFLSLFQIAYRFDEIGAGLMLHLVPPILVFATTITLPVSFLLSLTFTFSRMEADGEISTLQVSGVHLRTVFAPAFAMAVALCGFTYFMQIEILPNAQRDQRNLIRQGLNDVLANLSGGQRSINFHPDYRIHIESVEGSSMKGIIIQHLDRAKGMVRRKIHAREGTWRFEEARNKLLLELTGCEYTEYDRGDPVKIQKATTEVLPFEINFDEILAKKPKRLEDLTLEEISYVLEEKKSVPIELQTHYLRRWTPLEVEAAYHRRFADSAAPAVFVLIGAPLGIMARTRSRLVAFFIGFLPILVFYYPMMMIGASLAVSGKIPPWLGTWIGNITMGWVGITLTARVFRR